MRMTRERALRQRLTTQRLASAPLPTAGEVVRLLCCVQSQERDHAFYSLAMRSQARSYAAVSAEFNQGAFLRTHTMRGTWHFVLPEDLRWVLALVGSRQVSGMTARHSVLQLDDPRYVARSLDVLAGLLQDGNHLTRAEIGEEFARRDGLPEKGQRLGHLLFIAEAAGLIVSGPMKGVNHAYGLVDELVPPSSEVDREEAVARFVGRFFAGHGPATDRDFARWSSLGLTETRAAIAALGDRLARVEIDGVAHWFDPAHVARRSPAAPTAYLLPTYDEAWLTYPRLNFTPRSDAPPMDEQAGFWASVIVGEEQVGLWRRTTRGREVHVEARVAPSLDERGRGAVREAAERLAGFLGRDLELAVVPDR